MHAACTTTLIFLHFYPYSPSHDSQLLHLRRCVILYEYFVTFTHVTCATDDQQSHVFSLVMSLCLCLRAIAALLWARSPQFSWLIIPFWVLLCPSRNVLLVVKMMCRSLLSFLRKQVNLSRARSCRSTSEGIAGAKVLSVLTVLPG